MHEQSYIIDNTRKIPGKLHMNVNNDNLPVNRSHCKLITEAGRLRRIYVGIKATIIVKLREREGQEVDPGRSLKGHL